MNIKEKIVVNKLGIGFTDIIDYEKFREFVKNESIIIFDNHEGEIGFSYIVDRDLLTNFYGNLQYLCEDFPSVFFD